MRIVNGQTILHATDLSTHFGCQHYTKLNLLHEKGELEIQEYFDPAMEALRAKGEEFEAICLGEFVAQGLSVTKIDHKDKQALAATIQAMEAGADVIYQARLEMEIWQGWADFLVKVDKPSKFGDWSYEVWDTKLSNHTRASAILQISFYSFLLESMQGLKPEYMWIRNPLGTTKYRLDDYSAYFRLIKKKLGEFLLTQENQETYPEPVPHCEMCKFWAICDQRRRDDDHLTYIAGMGSMQIREVKGWGVQTLASMASLTKVKKPSRGSIETFIKLKEQARIQLQSRNSGKCEYELLDLVEEKGFFRLPEPSEGDIIFDFEGDPFVSPAGREYLFGWVQNGVYHHLWANTEAEEKQAFEEFMDKISQIRAEFPGMHIYHFSPYEPSAIKRLMGRFACCENEVDELLRGGVFVDLHSIVKQSIRAGVESYSLKELEKVHAFLRKIELRKVGPHKMLFESLLENGLFADAPVESIQAIKDYNEDDCRSTLSLRNWLEDQRARLVARGKEIPRPETREGEANERIREHQLRIAPIIEALMKGVPELIEERSNEEQARWLLANMLDWYRREDKSFWWEIYRMKDLDPEELIEEKAPLGGLEYTGHRVPVAKSVVDYYKFPVQDTEIKEGNQVRFQDDNLGTVYSIDFSKLEIGIKKSKNSTDIHPRYIICCDHIDYRKKEAAILRLAEWVIKNGMDAAGDYRAARDLLLRNAPRVNGKIKKTATASEQAIEWVKVLEKSVLPIQGPPGTGKSHTAANMILELVRQGKKIGVTALSHKVITGLLEKVHAEAKKQKQKLKIVQKVRELSEDPPGWEEATKKDEVLDELLAGAQIAAGTCFMWADEEFFDLIDVMFVDEAGQLSLIDTLALGQAAKNIVLLGDPQQLQQPQKGSHPEGTEVSALQHILGEHQTISAEQGVFLDKTWRMHPNICQYTSELFYESRLEPMPQNALQKLEGKTKYKEPGIYYEPVTHTGNRNSSPEEVARVSEIVSELLKGGVSWVNQKGEKQKLRPEHIKVIAPYNAQVNDLMEALPGIQVGTVDKFQGQEAPVIIFSMATSSPEDAPRGMEFLYSLNRLNVAVSRARAVFILVASPDLFEPNCRSPYQMQLANALCRLREVAKNNSI